jgi:cytidylate kinase
VRFLRIPFPQGEIDAPRRLALNEWTAMKRILVVEREYGAGGSSIAETLSQRLGWKLLDHSITDEIAKLARMRPEECKKREERLDPWLYRLAKVFWRGSHERAAGLADSGIMDADRLVHLTQEVIEQAAKTGECVIVGRAAAYFLRERSDVFCVFLYAPRDFKYQRVLARSKNEAEALDLVDSVDRERREFIKHYFGAEWPSRHLYDVMLNTRIGDDASVDLILKMLQAANERQDGGHQ